MPVPAPVKSAVAPTRRRRLLTVLAACVLAALPSVAFAADPEPAGTVPVQLLSIADFQGYFGDAPTTVPGSHAGEPAQQVGGGAYLASHLERLRGLADVPEDNSILFSAGDDFSGWPDETEWFWNEPTIEYLNMIGLDFSTVGNHELDRNLTYLKHVMDGTCEGRPDKDLCFADATGQRFDGADYEYYSSNVIDGATGDTVVKPYHVRYVDDGLGGKIPIGFVHATTSLTPSEGLSIWPSSQLSFRPEAAEVNKYVAELQAQGVQAIVAVLHEGFSQSGGSGYNDCTKPFGPVVEMNKEISSAVDAIVTGHWHALVNCMLPDPAGQPRPVVEPANHGRLLNEINLTIDRATGDVVRSATRSTNHANTRDIAPDPEVAAMAAHWSARLAQRRAQPVAQITGDLNRTSSDPEEATLPSVAADAYRWAGSRERGGADLGLSTPGTLLRDLKFEPTPGIAGDGPVVVTFGEAFFGTVFENGIGPAVTTAAVSGRELDALLESQWQKLPDGTVTFTPLAVSGNVSYRYRPQAAIGAKITFGQLRINGRPIAPDQDYRVATLATNFLPKTAKAPFRGLLDARDQYRTDCSGADAFANYLTAHSPVAPPSPGRATAR